MPSHRFDKLTNKYQYAYKTKKGEFFTEQHIAIHMYMCCVKISEDPNRNRKYMFERIAMKIMSETYIQYVPANLKKKIIL